MEVKIPIKDEYINGKLFTPKNDTIKKAVLFVHGWKSSTKRYLPLASSLVDKGYLSLAMNFRGCGDSPYDIKKYSRQDHLNDILGAYDYLSTIIIPSKIIVFGKSFGGYLCSIASLHRRIYNLILSQPALYPDINFSSPTEALIKKDSNIFRCSTKSKDTNMALRAIFEYKYNILFIESEFDEEIPKEVTDLYKKVMKKRSNSSQVLIRKADHTLSKPENLETYYKAITRWIVALR